MTAQKASDVTHTRIQTRKACLQRRDSAKVAARIAHATRGKSGFEADIARFNAMLNGVCDNIKARTPISTAIIHHTQPAPRRTRQATRPSAKSGDSNTSDDSYPEPDPDRPLQLFSFTTAAQLFDCSPQTLRNKVCRGLIPAPLQTAVGPRFTQDQLRQITTLTPTKPIPADVVPPVRRRKVGRPRIIAAGGKGGAS